VDPIGRCRTKLMLISASDVQQKKAIPSTHSRILKGYITVDVNFQAYADDTRACSFVEGSAFKKKTILSNTTLPCPAFRISHKTCGDIYQLCIPGLDSAIAKEPPVIPFGPFHACDWQE